MTETKSVTKSAPVTNNRSFWQKVRLRLLRKSALGSTYLRGEERLKDLGFRLNKANADAKYQDFSQCQSMADFFEFSVQNFGPHQVQSEITGFLEFAAQINPQSACEIGTAAGGTTFLLGQSLQSVRHMIGVDLTVRNKSKLRFFVRPTRQISLVTGSSYDPVIFAQVQQILADHKLDLLFIDGDHNYDGVKQDFLLYRHLVRPGGIIAFHDIMPDYMTRYGQNTGNWAGDVPKLWQRIKDLYPQHHEFVADRNQDGLGIGAIVYDPDVQIPLDLI
jgi:predicted O-methyltransferase YrrM